MSSSPNKLSSAAVYTMFRGNASVDFPETLLVVRLEARSAEGGEGDNLNRNSGGGGADQATSTNTSLKSPKQTQVLTMDGIIPVWVIDDSCRGRAFLIGSAAQEVTIQTTNGVVRTARLPCTVLVRGYITSEVNPGNPSPLLYVCAIDVLSPPHHNQRLPTTTSNKPDVQIPPTRIPGGKVVEFLNNMCHFLPNPELGGCPRLDCRSVSNFLEHAKAIQTLAASSFDNDAAITPTENGSSSSSAAANATTSATSPLSAPSTTDNGSSPNGSINNNSNSRTTSNAHTVFVTALSEFKQAQLDRQATTLSTHLARHPDKAEQIVKQHKEALQAALQYGGLMTGASTSTKDPQSLLSTPPPPLTVSILCQWHAALCNDLHATSGKLRTNHVRVGQLAFRHPRSVRKDLIRVCEALHALEARLKHDNTLECGYKAALYASAVFFAIVDSHSFSDGNGRLARISSNFALQRMGFDIPIHWFASPAQRHEYTRAIAETRRNLYLLPRGQVDQETLVRAYQVAGAFHPLTELLMERMKKAVSELTKLIQDKQRAVQEQTEIHAARMFRERAAEGNCLICFDDKPNIATLCCGKAVHLNCMCEWILSKNSCPNCRGDLPALPPRLLRRRRNGNNDDDNSDDDDTADDDRGEEDDNSTASDASNPFDDGVSTSSTVSESNLIHEFEQAILSELARMSSNDGNDTTTDDDSSVAGAVMRTNHRVPRADADGTTMSVDNGDDNTTENDDAGNQNHSAYDTASDPSTTEELGDYCLNCTNKAARDCQNHLCGRCCQADGYYHCPRHSTVAY